VILSWINRCRHPLLVSGTWDFVGVLLAASGFLLMGGPAILQQVYEQWRVPGLLGQSSPLPDFAQPWETWNILWVTYFTVVVAVSALVLWRRRRQTSIYNVLPDLFEEVFCQILDRLGLEWSHLGGNLFCLRERKDAAEAKEAILGRLQATANTARLTQQPVATRMQQTASAQEICVHVDSSPLFRHVSLDWSPGGEAIRGEIEEELARTLAELRTGRNPASRWFTLAALALFSLALTILIAMLVYRLLQLRH
jgi:hypothetical protein